jgi:hypothetical protein
MSASHFDRKHPRNRGDGRFVANPHPEGDTDLGAPGSNDGGLFDPDAKVAANDHPDLLNREDLARLWQSGSSEPLSRSPWISADPANPVITGEAANVVARWGRPLRDARAENDADRVARNTFSSLGQPFAAREVTFDFADRDTAYYMVDGYPGVRAKVTEEGADAVNPLTEWDNPGFVVDETGNPYGGSASSADPQYIAAWDFALNGSMDMFECDYTDPARVAEMLGEADSWTADPEHDVRDLERRAPAEMRERLAARSSQLVEDYNLWRSMAECRESNDTAGAMRAFAETERGAVLIAPDPVSRRPVLWAIPAEQIGERFGSWVASREQVEEQLHALRTSYEVCAEGRTAAIEAEHYDHVSDEWRPVPGTAIGGHFPDWIQTPDTPSGHGGYFSYQYAEAAGECIANARVDS